MAITSENTIFKDTRSSELSRVICPQCREITENVAISLRDPLFSKWRKQHAIDCAFLVPYENEFIKSGTEIEVEEEEK